MSDIFQPGLTMDQAHPDADQLTAFAEHALPPHEQQQTLAHLATCADCRQIVFLAQQAVEMEAIEPLPMRIRKPWFAGWNLVLPAMLAVAGIVAFSLYLRNFSKPATRLDAVTTAQVEPQSPPVAPVPAAAIERPAEEPSPSATPRKKESIAPPTPNALAPTAEAKATTPIVIEQKPSANLSQAKAAPQAVTIHGATTIHGAMAGASAAQGGAAIPAPAPLPLGASNRVRLGALSSGPAAQQVQASEFATARDQLAQNQMATAPVTLADRAAQPKAQLSTGGAAPLPPAPQAAPIVAASQTVTVDATSAASSVQLDTHSADGYLFENGRANLPLLPSHLAASSSARQGAVWLALDTAGGLYWTKDQGRHWKHVKAVWDGPAAKVSHATSLADPAFELTTDKGVFWTSADGQHWKQRGGGITIHP